MRKLTVDIVKVHSEPESKGADRLDTHNIKTNIIATEDQICEHHDVVEYFGSLLIGAQITKENDLQWKLVTTEPLEIGFVS